MCCLQRPFDDRSQVRVAEEAEAILGILAFCESGQAMLVSSVALEFEVRKNPHSIRKAYTEDVLSHAKHFVALTEEIESLSRQFAREGLKPLDALHVACAIFAQADFFCTCDDGILKRAKAIATGSTRVVTPPELIQEIDS